MLVKSEIIELKTHESIAIYNITDYISKFIEVTGLKNGHALVFSRHTTTALAINEYEERLLEDIKVHLDKLAPKDGKYLHNDLHLRIVPPDEPINAHSHLMAMMLNNSEYIPIIDGQLALGTYQSVLFVELDGPRDRTVLIQVSGET
ncbi:MULTISPECIES: secondary thiamine-phosphate synthase enzyme YjbQ [unclassified Moorena]|nr:MULTISPECIES: secondary thiamine-phosphate synthase enzyme YjbQ [unclassified Moorena]NEO15860.1 YjbQ family protein [Moorena sp. SIO3E8]NEQ02336.1 YjbQ family protein [Moorena sp. SIO3F7]